MENNMLLSVIVPCYNIEKFIENTVNSILSQTYTDLEVILVNDGSTDNTLSVISSLRSADSRIKVVDKENGGVTSARLRGVKEASGELIAFVDGDDELEPDMYERLIKNLSENDADISHCGHLRITKTKETPFYGTGKFLIQDNKQGLSDLLNGQFIEPGLWNKVFKKKLFGELLSDASPLDCSIKLTEDLLMNYLLFRNSSKSVYEDFCGYRYIVHSESVSNAGITYGRLTDPMKVIKILLSETKSEEDLNAIIRKKYVRELITLSCTNVKTDPQLIKPIHKQRLSELRKKLITVLKDGGIDNKLKIMAVVTAISPALYRKIHNLYKKKTGLDKIYD